MIRYLADSSALWRLLRDPEVRAGWSDVISDHAIGSCQPQRTEFRRSARNLDEFGSPMTGTKWRIHPLHQETTRAIRTRFCTFAHVLNALR